MPAAKGGGSRQGVRVDQGAGMSGCSWLGPLSCGKAGRAGGWGWALKGLLKAGPSCLPLAPVCGGWEGSWGCLSEDAPSGGHRTSYAWKSGALSVGQTISEPQQAW